MSPSKILTLIAAILMAGTAALGFLNKQELDKRKGETEAANLKAANSAKEAADNKTAQVAAEKERDEQKGKADQAAADLAVAKNDLNAAKTKSTELETQLAAKTKELEDATAKLAANGNAAPLPDNNGADAEAKVKELEGQIAAAQTENKVLGEQIAGLQGRVAEAEAKEKARQNAIMSKGLEGTVLAYNPAWNFVVINVGDKQSVTEGAEMIVVRDGRMLGKVRITSVERGTSIADIEAGSLTTGAQIQPGDKVIYPGS